MIDSYLIVVLDFQRHTKIGNMDSNKIQANSALVIIAQKKMKQKSYVMRLKR